MTPRTLITGMSGTGKSSVVSELKTQGYFAVDADVPGWSSLKEFNNKSSNLDWNWDEKSELDWVWDETKVRDFLDHPPAEFAFFVRDKSKPEEVPRAI